MSRFGKGGVGANVYQTLVKRIHIETERIGMTTADLVEQSLIDESRLSHIVQGEAKDITLREMVGLSLALNVPVTSLLTPQ